MNFFQLKTTLLFVLSLSVMTVKGQALSKIQNSNHSHNHSKTSGLQFIENQNQWHSNIKFLSPLGGLNYVYLEDNAFTYKLLDEVASSEIHDLMQASDEIRESHIIPGHTYKVHFLNALTPTFKGNEKRSGHNSYFLGNDPSRWASEVPVYHQVVYENIYSNIQLATYSQSGNFKYDFIVSPNGNPSDIELLYEGADALYLDAGDLVIETSVKTIKELKPYAYQIVDGKETPIACHYNLRNDVLTFDFPEGFIWSC